MRENTLMNKKAHACITCIYIFKFKHNKVSFLSVHQKEQCLNKVVVVVVVVVVVNVYTNVLATVGP